MLTENRLPAYNPPMSEKTPRLAPGRPFPPYAYVGGEGPHPHPRNHPDGHSRNAPESVPDPLDPERWWQSEAYLHGIDLFNHGYYWEAHEEWEGLWNAAGRRGPVSEFLKGLIKLTAAGFKAREGHPDGVRKHAQRAAAHFQATLGMLDTSRFAGFGLADLLEFARHVEAHAGEWPRHPGEPVVVVFDRVLSPAPPPAREPS